MINWIFIYSVVTKHTLNTFYPYNFHSTQFSWEGDIFRIKVQSGHCYEVVVRKTTVEFNVFDNYNVHVLIPPYIETFGP